MSSESENDVCPICYEEKYLEFSSVCGHSFCYLCLKQALIVNNKCPMCRTELSRDLIEEAEGCEDIKGKWMYSGRNNGWWYYDKESDKIIEDHYQRQDQLFSVEIMGKNYSIDLDNMTQTAPNNFVRQIKRKCDEEDIVKGIAGLQIIGSK